jgi:hypothetical protein
MDSSQKAKFITRLLALAKGPEERHVLQELFCCDQLRSDSDPDLESHSRPVSYYLLRTVGAASLLLGGAGLMTDISFIFSTSFVYLGLLVLIIDPWIEPSLKKVPIRWRGIPSLIFTIPLVLFSVFVVFLPSPLEVAARDNAGTYPDGEVIGGIEWNPKFSDVRVVFRNSTTHEYRNLDFTVSTGYLIIASAQTSNLPGVTVYNTAAGPDQVLGSAKDVRGNTVYLSYKNTTFASGGIRFTCDRLPRGMALEIILAVINLPKTATRFSYPVDPNLLVTLVRNREGSNLDQVGPKVIVDEVGIAGTYESLGRRPHRIHSVYPVKLQ